MARQGAATQPPRFASLTPASSCVQEAPEALPKALRPPILPPMPMLADLDDPRPSRARGFLIGTAIAMGLIFTRFWVLMVLVDLAYIVALIPAIWRSRRNLLR